jgi:hypothetical protein
MTYVVLRELRDPVDEGINGHWGIDTGNTDH